MTEEDRESATIIAMPIEEREPPEPPAPGDECGRWISVAFIACGIKSAGADDEGARQLLLWSLLDKFADVPDVWEPAVMPTRDNAPAFARYAVKKLLQALTASDDERQRAARAMDTLFERVFPRNGEEPRLK
jgi:hypothetical protein